MKKACLYNDIENPEDSFCEPCLKLLQEKLLNLGYDLKSQNVNDPEKCEFTLYFNMPVELSGSCKNKYVWIAEPPVIYKRNFKKNKYKNFNKIFTWDTGLEGENVVKLNYPQIFYDVDFDLSGKEKLCCLIAKNKYSTRKNELFSERQKAIKWFEKHAPEDFDLYGNGWDGKTLEHFGLIKYRRPAFVKCYKGYITNKRETLKKYKFSIAYENWLNNRGYITEKIFDCFNASTVPVYLGATNIGDFVDENCFIDKRQFKTYESLYNYMKNMPESEYLKYLENIQTFIKSQKSKAYSLENWVDTVIREVVL